MTDDTINGLTREAFERWFKAKIPASLKDCLWEELKAEAERPQSVEFETTVIGRQLNTGIINGLILNDLLDTFIGKCVRVRVEEIIK